MLKELAVDSGLRMDSYIFQIIAMVLKEESFYTLQWTIITHLGFC